MISRDRGDPPRPMPDYFCSQWPMGVREALWAIEESDKYDYMDNYRAYPVIDEKQRDEFYQAKENGCCGSYEETIEIDHPLHSRQMWVIGFNYGH